MTTESNPSAKTKAPSHAVYHVRDRDGAKAFWTRVGSAWPHADGKGLSVQLDCTPLDGRLSLRVITEKRD